MGEVCEVCSREFILKQEWKRPKYLVCSEACRNKIYAKLKQIQDIESGNYHTMNVKRIEELGFEVIVRKK